MRSRAAPFAYLNGFTTVGKRGLHHRPTSQGGVAVSAAVAGISAALPFLSVGPVVAPSGAVLFPPWSTTRI